MQECALYGHLSFKRTHFLPNQKPVSCLGYEIAFYSHGEIKLSAFAVLFPAKVGLGGSVGQCEL